MVRAEGPGGMIGDAVLILAPGDPMYDEWDEWQHRDEWLRREERGP
jgi:hypothetical protein